MKAPRISTLLSAIIFSIASISSLSAISSSVPMEKAVQEAQALVRNYPGWKVMLADGGSMDPHFAKGDVLLVDDAPLSRIRDGMMVVYMDSEGDLVGHTVVGSEADSFIVRGINNSRDDHEHVTSSNYRGVIVGVLHTDGRGRVSDLPVVLGKRN